MEKLSEARIYVGTYAKYNEGSIFGKWMDLSDYSGREEFYDACRELHSDEEDPELMFQDWENIPSAFIGESWLSDNIFEFMEAISNLSETEQDAFAVWLNYTSNDLSSEDIDDLISSFEFFYRLTVDYDFLDLYGIRISEGRSFSRDMVSDEGYAYIINREAADRMELESAMGSRFGFREQMGTVVGIVEDFHFESLQKPITPLAIGVDESRYFTYISVRFKGENIQNTLERIEESWKLYAPAQPFEYTFMDERMEQLYRKDRQLSASMMVLSLMALFISCLGIFGLISFSLRERTKEVGIRKVLGAAPFRMAIMLTLEILLIIVLSTILGGVLGCYGSRALLGQFASRFDMGVDLVLISMLITLLMAILPLAYRIVKTVLANPVDSLRTD